MLSSNKSVSKTNLSKKNYNYLPAGRKLESKPLRDAPKMILPISFYQSKKAWIRIVEAFVAMLIITGIVLLLVGKGQIKKEDSSIKIYELENSMLREIQTNDSLRQEILNVPGASLPLSWAEMGILTPNVNQKIQFNTPSYLICQARICLLTDSCPLNINLNKDIYARGTAITANLTSYSPRQLKLFCWKK